MIASWPAPLSALLNSIFNAPSFLPLLNNFAAPIDIDFNASVNNSVHFAEQRRRSQFP